MTKGLDRYKVVVAKTLTLVLLWTALFWLCAGITYGCNEIFWDNQDARHLLLSIGCWWVFGVWVLMLTVLFSVLFPSNIGVLGCTAGVVLVSDLLSLLPKLQDLLPTFLMNGNPLIYGVAKPEDYGVALGITGGLTVLFFLVSIPVFNKKQL